MYATSLRPRGADARHVKLILDAWREQGPPTLNRANRRRTARDMARSTTLATRARYDPATELPLPRSPTKPKDRTR